MRILLPNITSPRNVGDLAMLKVLLSIVKRTHPHAEITIHISEPELYDNQARCDIRQNVYSWALFPNTSYLVRIVKAAYVLWSICAFRFFGFLPKNPTLKRIFSDYRDADLIIFAGGGYLRSQAGIKQGLGLLTLASVYLLAAKNRCRKIMMPISFGPFAAQWQAKLFGHLLQNIDVVFSREEISHGLLKQFGVQKARRGEDLAILELARTRTAPSQAVFGFTVREWFERTKQLQFESHVSAGLSRAAKEHDALIQPVVQVHAPDLGDNDLGAVERIAEAIRKTGATVLPVKFVNNLDDAQLVYGNLTLLLGMRMHSNLLCAIAGTPFVALAYEHKTEGIMMQLNLEEFCLSAAAVTGDAIALALNALCAQRSNVEKALKMRLDEIAKTTIPVLEESLRSAL